MSVAFDHLDSTLEPVPAFYIEPRDRDPRPELDRQAAFVKLAKRAGLKPVAVPNGSKRGQFALNRAKKEGVRWGFPDIIVTAPGRFVAFLEFKNGRDGPEPHQIECLNDLYRQGFPVGVFRTPETAMRFLAQAGAPLMDLAA